MSENNSKNLSYTGDIKAHVIILIIGIGSFATFLTIFLNGLNRYLGTGIKIGYYLFVLLYFFLVPFILILGSCVRNNEFQRFQPFAPVYFKIAGRYARQNPYFFALMAISMLLIISCLFLFLPIQKFKWVWRALLIGTIFLSSILALFAILRLLTYFPNKKKETIFRLFGSIFIELGGLVLVFGFTLLLYCKMVERDDKQENNEISTKQLFIEYDLNKTIQSKYIENIDNYEKFYAKAEEANYQRLLRGEISTKIERLDSLRYEYEQKLYYYKISQDTILKEDLLRLKSDILLKIRLADSERIYNRICYVGEKNLMIKVFSKMDSLRSAIKADRTDFVFNKIDGIDSAILMIDRIVKGVVSKPPKDGFSIPTVKAITYEGRKFAKNMDEDVKSNWLLFLKQLQYKGLLWLFSVLFFCFVILCITRIEYAYCDIILSKRALLNEQSFTMQDQIAQNITADLGGLNLEETKNKIYDKGLFFKKIILVLILLIIPFFKPIEKKDINLEKPFLQFNTIEDYATSITNNTLKHTGNNDDGPFFTPSQPCKNCNDSIDRDFYLRQMAVYQQSISLLTSKLNTLIQISEQCCNQKDNKAYHDSQMKVLSEMVRILIENKYEGFDSMMLKDLKKHLDSSFNNINRNMQRARPGVRDRGGAVINKDTLSMMLDSIFKSHR